MGAGLTRPAAVLWDWDNTLVDNWDTIGLALNRTLTAFGHAPWTPQEVRDRVRVSMRDSFPALFGSRWEEAGCMFHEAFAEHHLDALKPLPGAEQMLRAVADTGAYQAVVSNKTGRFLRAEAGRLEWSRWFGRLVGAGDAARDKPAPEPVGEALSGSAAVPGPTVWFVGDTSVDIACARNSGCRAVLIRAHAPREPEFEGLQPDVHVTDTAGFLALLSRV